MTKLKIRRSKVIAETLVAHGEREEVAAEGYRFYAQEASEFAAASLQAVSEVLGCGGLRRIAHIPMRSGISRRYDHEVSLLSRNRFALH